MFWMRTDQEHRVPLGPGAEKDVGRRVGQGGDQNRCHAPSICVAGRSGIRGPGRIWGGLTAARRDEQDPGKPDRDGDEDAPVQALSEQRHRKERREEG